MVTSSNGTPVNESPSFWVPDLATPQREWVLTSPSTEGRSNSKNKSVKRPMNAFMVFSQLERRRIKDMRKNSNIPWDNIEISIELGERWRQLSAAEKAPYIAEADRLKRIHSAEHPEYKYEPRKRTKRSKKVPDADSASDVSNSPDVSHLSTPSDRIPTPYDNSYKVKNFCKTMPYPSPLPNQTSLAVPCQMPPIMPTPKLQSPVPPRARLPMKRAFSSQGEPVESCTVLKRLLRSEPKEEIYNSSVHRGPSFCEQCALYNQDYLHPTCYTTSEHGQSQDFVDLDESTESFNKENDNGMRLILRDNFCSFPPPMQNVTVGFCDYDAFNPLSSCLP